MKIVQAGVNASFTYPSADQLTGLFLQASIFDITGGGSSLVDTQALTANGVNGAYYGTFVPVVGKIYCVIVANYTDDTFTTIDTGTAPWAEIYKEITNTQGFFGFNYGVFDQSAVNVAALIYDVTAGLTFVTKVNMAELLAGVYVGTYQGVALHSYSVLKYVYTDGTYTTISTNWSPAADDIDGLVGANTVNVAVPYPVAVQFQAQIQAPQLVAEIDIEPDLSI